MDFVIAFLFPKLVKLAKRLKKEKVNVDIINFGEEVSIIVELKQNLLLNRIFFHQSISLNMFFSNVISGGEYREADGLYKHS